MSQWLLLDTKLTSVAEPPIVKEPEWVQLDTLTVSVPIPEVVKDWVEIHQVGVQISPLTPVGEWKLLQTMTVAVSAPGEPAPPIPIPPTVADEKKTNWWLWGGIAAAVIAVIAIARRKV